MTAPRYVLGGCLTVAALLAIAVVALTVYEDIRRDDFVEERSSSRALSVTDRGPIPREVRESSGLAVSRTHAGIFWTHNDSGDRPRLYAMDSAATLVATIEVEGVEARDWEDIDIGPCPALPEATEWCLYVADTGDNGRRRESVTIYVVSEPAPNALVGTTEALGAFRFSYEGGPFDVEALALAPRGDLVVATKGRAPPIRLFTVEAAEVARVVASGETARLRDPIGLPIEPDFRIGRQVTGAAFTAAGTVLALRTYAEVYFYRWPMGDQPSEAAPACLLGYDEPVGEAISFSVAGRMFLTSESSRRRAGRLLEVECTGVGGLNAPR